MSHMSYMSSHHCTSYLPSVSRLSCPSCRRAVPSMDTFQAIGGRLDMVLKFPVKEGAVDLAAVPVGPPLNSKDSLP